MVKHEDRVSEVSHLHLGLRMVGLDVSYETADLIMRVAEKVEEKGGEADISDMTKIDVEHERKWREYHEKRKEEYRLTHD